MSEKELMERCERIDEAWRNRDRKLEKQLNDELVEILTKERVAADIRKEKLDKYAGIAALILIPVLVLIFSDFILAVIIAIPFIGQALAKGGKV